MVTCVDQLTDRLLWYRGPHPCLRRGFVNWPLSSARVFSPLHPLGLIPQTSQPTKRRNRTIRQVAPHANSFSRSLTLLPPSRRLSDNRDNLPSPLLFRPSASVSKKPNLSSWLVSDFPGNLPNLLSRLHRFSFSERALHERAIGRARILANPRRISRLRSQGRH